MATFGQELVTGDPVGTWSASEPQWGLVLAQLSDGADHGADFASLSGASEPTFIFQHNRPNTCTFKLPLTHPALPDLMENQHCIVKAYKRRKLACTYETTSIQLAGGSGGRWAVVVATEASYVRLAKRHIGMSTAGVLYENDDRGGIAAEMIDEINAVDPTGVLVGGVFPSSSATAGPWHYKPVIEAIQELGEPLNGFDHWFVPADPYRDANDAVGYLYVAPLRGAYKPEAIFEFGPGTRANIAEYSWQIDVSDRITRAYSLPAGYPDNAGLIVQSQFDAGLEAIINRREAIVQSDLVDSDLRQELVDEHVEIRGNPRNIYTFQPDIDDLSGRVPAFLIDYDIGDLITPRVLEVGHDGPSNPLVMLDGVVRVYGVTVSVDPNGQESIDMTVVQE